MRRPGLRATLFTLAALGLFWVGWRAASEAGPNPARWLEEMPAHAAAQGYSRYRWWERGRAWSAAPPPRPNPAGPLLVDRWHSRKQPWDARLAPEARSYDQMHGLGRAFDPVREAGVDSRELWAGLAINPGAALDGAAALFVNLPSGDGPGFRWAEVRAIEAFVRAGGGLLLLTDHTNCYGHADMLGQLAGQLGITLPAVTALDPQAGLGIGARAWFRASRIAPHPITEGVTALGFMTAGRVDGLQPLVTTSESGWGDRGDALRSEDSSGFTGNLEREPEEPNEAVPVVAAGEVGAGRVVVLADQNAWGATMIGYGDNARLFTQALGWVLRRPLALPQVDVATLGPGCADASALGFRTLQVELARRGRDACEGATTAERVVVLPGAAVPNSGRALVLDEGLTGQPPLVWSTGGAEGRGGAAAVMEDNRLRIGSALLRNASLGDERRDPNDAEVAGYREALTHALDWLFSEG